MVDAVEVIFLATKEERQPYRSHADTARTNKLYTGPGFKPTTFLLQIVLNVANLFTNHIFNNDS